MRYKFVMSHDDENKRVHVLFSGRVQGVGFRFTVCRIAESLEVSGFVRNLWDGNVELVAEGTEQSIADFLREIRNSQLRRYITNERLKWDSFTGEFNRFGVAFS